VVRVRAGEPKTKSPFYKTGFLFDVSFSLLVDIDK